MANQATSNQEPSTAKVTNGNTAPASASNAGRKRRSCLMCSKRKVKCDKQKPCICCVKAGIECVFPAASSNRTEVGVSPDLVEMLQRLEKAVQTLGPSSTERTGGPSSRGDRQTDLGQPLDPTTTLGGLENQTDAGICAQDTRTEIEIGNLGHAPEGKAPSVSSSHEQGPGKIIRDHGRDTYVRRWFWDDGNVEVRLHMISHLLVTLLISCRLTAAVCQTQTVTISVKTRVRSKVSRQASPPASWVTQGKRSCRFSQT